MSKHTPGPWHLINDHCVGGPESTNGAGQGVAMCGMRARSEDEAKANARLIAAAPDLLEALKYALSYQPKDDSCDPWASEARAAVAKAEGGAA